MNEINLGNLDVTRNVFEGSDQQVPSEISTVQKSQFTILTYPDTDIYIDGEYRDHAFGNWIMIIVTYGTHTVKVTKPGYQDYIRTVNINTRFSMLFVDRMIRK